MDISTTSDFGQHYGHRYSSRNGNRRGRGSHTHTNRPKIESTGAFKHKGQERHENKLRGMKLDPEHFQRVREQEAGVVHQYFVSESTLITCGAGLDIQHVIPGFELCQVTIKNLPPDAKVNEVEDILIQQGIAKFEFCRISMRKQAGGTTNLQAVFSVKAEHGEMIAAGLEGIKLREAILSFDVTQNINWHTNSMGSKSNHHTTLVIWWYDPATTLIATYDSVNSAATRQQEMDQKIFRGRLVKAVINNGAGRRRNGNTSVKLLNLPVDTLIDEELVEFTDTRELRLISASSSARGSSFSGLREILVDHVRGWDGIQIDSLRDLPRNPLKGESKVEVSFDSWENARAAYDAVNKRRVGNPGAIFHAYLPHPHEYEIRIPKNQYEVQKCYWDELSDRKGGCDALVKIRTPNGQQPYLYIKVVGKDKKAVGALKVRVESLASGEKLGSQAYWHSSFASNRALPFFQRVKKETGVLVRNDFKTRSLKVYGDASKFEDAYKILKDEVERLREEEVIIQIEPWMVRFFVNKGLQELKELLGEDHIRLNIATRKVIVKGGDESTQQVHRLIKELCIKGRAQSTSSAGKGTEVACAVCTDTASHPEMLVCGHTYCNSCLKHFIVSAVDGTSFPIVCIGDNNSCHQPIPIPVLCKFLTPQAFDSLVGVVFRVYMDKHSQEVKYCPTTDCNQTYRTGGEDHVQCPSCFAKFCPTCDEAHENMSCAQWKVHKDPDAEYESLGGLGFKKCPNCRVWVDRTEGCNHMTCAKCEAHFCWSCLARFETGGEVYQHMQILHGGIYEDELRQPGMGDGGGGLNRFGDANYHQQQQELFRIQQDRERRELIERVQQFEQLRQFEAENAQREMLRVQEEREMQEFMERAQQEEIEHVQREREREEREAHARHIMLRMAQERERQEREAHAQQVMFRMVSEREEQRTAEQEQQERQRVRQEQRLRRENRLQQVIEARRRREEQERREEEMQRDIPMNEDGCGCCIVM